MDELLTKFPQLSAEAFERFAKRDVRRSLAAKETGAIHGTWQFENMMLSYIRDGEVEKLLSFLAESQKRSFSVGTLATDPLRQAKNLMIGLTAVVGKVAGIGGGMDVEDVYRLMDLYTQEVEKCVSVESVTWLQFNMILDFTERVRQAKLPENLSREVFDAVQFIADHTHESVGIDDVASAVGLSRSSLTRRFRAELGKSITQYITETKIRDAKRLLRYSDKTFGEIAVTLAFSSQAYFQTVFKKETGLTPGEYRRRHDVK